MKFKKGPRNIKNYLISKDIQLKIIITNLFYLILVVIVLLLTIISPYFYDIFKADEIWVQYLSAKTFSILLDRLIIAIPLLFAISFIHLTLLTHKFCGPIINIKNTLKELSKGNLSRKVYLRKGDFLKEEALIINNIIDFQFELFSQMSNENFKLLAKIEKELSKNSQEHDVRIILNELKESLNTSKKLLNKICFKIDNTNLN